MIDFNSISLITPETLNTANMATARNATWMPQRVIIYLLAEKYLSFDSGVELGPARTRAWKKSSHLYTIIVFKVATPLTIRRNTEYTIARQVRIKEGATLTQVFVKFMDEEAN